MTTESKVPGFDPGEFVRDPADQRFTAALPRNKDEAEGDYTKRLVAQGLVLVIEREALRTGGYPKQRRKRSQRRPASGAAR